MESHPCLWRRIRRVRRIQVCMACKGLIRFDCIQFSREGKPFASFPFLRKMYDLLVFCETMLIEKKIARSATVTCKQILAAANLLALLSQVNINLLTHTVMDAHICYQWCWASAGDQISQYEIDSTQWGLCAYVIVHTVLPVILWTELGGKPKWLPLNFGYHDIMHAGPHHKLQYPQKSRLQHPNRKNRALTNTGKSVFFFLW